MAIKFLGDIDVTGSHNLVAADIPSLDAGKITSGSFATARIPNLDASKITSGTLGSARIPDLSATYATAAHTHTFASLTSKPTTLSGYGITDAASSTHNHDSSYTKKFFFDIGSSGGTRRYIKLFTTSNFDDGVVGILSSGGDYGDPTRASYQIHVGTRTSIDATVFQLSQGGVADDFSFYYKDNGSSQYEIWCLASDYNFTGQTEFVVLSDYGDVTYNFDSVTTTAPSGLVAISKYLIWHSGNFTDNHTNWDTAYSWGNHAGLYAAASHTHTDADLNTWHNRETVNIDTYNPDSNWSTSIATSTSYGAQPNNYTNIHNLGGDGVDYQTQIATYYGNNNRMWVRSRYDGTNAWLGWNEVWTSGSFANNSANWDAAYSWGDHSAAGYLTTVPTTFSATQITLGAGVVIKESTQRPDLLSVSSSTTGWGGLQITNSAGDGLWSYMVDGSAAGIYNEQQSQWHIYCVENGITQLRHAGTTKFETSATGVNISGEITTTGGNSVNWNTAYGWGNHASAGYLASSSYTAADVLTKIKTVDGSGSGLDADLIDGYDSGTLWRRVSATNATAGGGWITVAHAYQGGRYSGEVIVTDGESGDHSFIRIHWMRSYADSNFTVLNCGGHSNRITGARVLYQTSDDTYGWKYLQVYVTTSSNYYVRVSKEGDTPNFGNISAVVPVVENTKTGYAVHGKELTGLDNASLAAEEGIIAGGNIYTGGTIYTNAQGSSVDWNTAYGWGDHSAAGYLNGSVSLGYIPQANVIGMGNSGLANNSANGNDGLLGQGISYTDPNASYSAMGFPDWGSSSILGGFVSFGSVVSWDTTTPSGDGANFSSTMGIGDVANFEGTFTNAYNYGAYSINVNPVIVQFSVFGFLGSQGMVFDPFGTGALSVPDVIITSDRNAKKNIENVTNGLDVVTKLQGVEYDIKETDKHSSGFIAQDVQEVIPHAVTETDSGLKMNYNAIIAYQNEAIKELKGMIDELKEELKSLKNG